MLRPKMRKTAFSFFLLLLLYPGLALSQKVPVSFDRFHGFAATENYLKSVAAAYPDITELLVIGESQMGRPVYVLVVSDKKTGVLLDRMIELRNPRTEKVNNVPPMTHDQAKPGVWICGATHGNEFTGTEVCLYTINKLVTGFGTETEVSDLIRRNVFYVCPMVNPDGVYNSVDKDFSQRGNSLLKDDDKDGKINEDGYDDLDGDGRITWFRYRDPKGNYIQDDIDPRVMIRLGDKEKTDKPRWSMIREDKDNDGDGKRGEDGEQGFDLNRNFPEGWWNEEGFQGGAGDYPTSAPEVQAVVEFMVNHRNILMAQFYHTPGGYVKRPMGTASDSVMHPKDIAVYDFILGKRYVELMGDDIPPAWSNVDSIDKFKKELQKSSGNRYAIRRGYEFPQTWRVSYREKDNQRYGFGLQSDWAYQQLGIYSLTTELFNYRKDLPGHTFTGEDAWVNFQRAAIKYQEDHAGGKWFRDWKPFDHPELGKGETGGWLPQFSGNAFPGEMLEHICETHWQYELFRAGLLPAVTVKEAKGKVLEKSDGLRLIEVTATIENVGKLPTHLARGADLPGNRQDVAWLVCDRDKVIFMQGPAFQRLGVLSGKLRIPGFPQGKSTSEVKWLVKVKGNEPLKVVASSQKGGTSERDVEIQ